MKIESYYFPVEIDRWENLNWKIRKLKKLEEISKKRIKRMDGFEYSSNISIVLNLFDWKKNYSININKICPIRIPEKKTEYPKNRLNRSLSKRWKSVKRGNLLFPQPSRETLKNSISYS